MRRAILLLMACAAAAPAADRAFDDIVRSFESHYGKKRMRIPMFGAVKFFMNVGRPAGASGFQLAIWEDVDNRDVDGQPAIAQFFARENSPWHPWVSTRESSGERTHIYVDSTGGHWKMLVVTMERNETTVVQMRLSASAVRNWLRDPAHSNQHSRQRRADRDRDRDGEDDTP